MLEAIILGFIQGITEFLPVSSTAHLILLPWLFDWTGVVDTLTFDVALHAGTLAALLLCFWRDWVELIARKQRLLILVCIASVPAGIAGLLLNDVVEKDLRSPLLISVMLVAFGIVMLRADKSRRYKRVDEVTLVDAVIIGLSQAIAIVPGVSRSGITISAGLFRGLEREAAARFSFLLSTPIIGAAALLHAQKAVDSPGSYDARLFIAGFLVSFVAGFVAIKFMLRFLKRYPLTVFVSYRFALAVVIIAMTWFRGYGG